MNKNMTKMLIFVLLLTLMIGIVSATENTTDNQNTNPTTNNDETSKTIQEQNEKIKDLENTLDTLNKTSTLRAIPENTTVGDSKVAVTLTNNMGKSIDNAPIIVKNTKNKTIGNGTTNTDGIAVININTLSGTEKIRVTYPGDNNTEASTFTTSITTVKHNTTVNVDPMIGTVGENLTLTAHIKDEHNNPVNGGNLVFKLNGKTLRKDGRFDSNATSWKLQVNKGLVTVTVKADLYLRNTKNITASYSGSYKYNEAKSNVETAQIRKRNAQLTVTATPKTLKHYETITFTAKLKDTTKGTKNTTSINQNTKVLFKMDGITIKDAKDEKLLTKVTNNTATYKYTIPQVLSGTTRDGTTKNHTIEAVLASDTFYPDTRNKTTFTVQRNPTKISINTIKPVTYKKNITITGKFTDTHNKTIANTKIKLTINNKNYTVKTDNNGIFQKTITANKTGTNNISLSYPGNTNYLPSTAKTTFQTNKIKIKITFNLTNKKIFAGEPLGIKGKLTDEYNNPIKDTFVKIINEKSDEIGWPYVNEDGEFYDYVYVESIGNHTIGVSFDGDKIYAPTVSTKNYVTEPKVNLDISIDSIKPTKLGEKTLLTGRLINPSEIPIRNLTINFKLNNDNKTQKIVINDSTKEEEFKVVLKSNIVGTNNITATSLENDITFSTSSKDTFTVYNNTPSNLTIPIKNDYEIFDIGYESFEYYATSLNSGYITIKGYENFNPVHKIVESKMYLKDKNNRTIVISGSKSSFETYDFVYDYDLTPYNIEVKLKELTKKEDENYFYLLYPD